MPYFIGLTSEEDVTDVKCAREADPQRATGRNR